MAAVAEGALAGAAPLRRRGSPLVLKVQVPYATVQMLANDTAYVL